MVKVLILIHSPISIPIKLDEAKCTLVTCEWLCDDLEIRWGSLVEVGRSIGGNMPKACNFFEVTHSTWSIVDDSLGCLRSVGMLATLIKNGELH